MSLMVYDNSVYKLKLSGFSYELVWLKIGVYQLFFAEIFSYQSLKASVI
jgi:hypothetical protein